jgi:hypothetical protein
MTDKNVAVSSKTVAEQQEEWRAARAARLAACPECERLRAEIQELTCGDPRKVCPNCRDKIPDETQPVASNQSSDHPHDAAAKTAANAFRKRWERDPADHGDACWVVGYMDGFEDGRRSVETAARPDAEALAAVPTLRGAKALVLYFPTDADRDEFVALIHEAKPNMRSVKL